MIGFAVDAQGVAPEQSPDYYPPTLTGLRGSQFERETRSQLGRTLVDGGFDPARDIAAITVNRWPHGYTYNYNTLFDPVEWCLSSPDDRACIVGRKQFGRVSIANADAAGSSHTDAAIDMAYRAVGEAVESRTRGVLSNVTRSSSPQP